MPNMYLTPASISYLTQLLLTFIIMVYLISHSLDRDKRSFLRRDGVARYAKLTIKYHKGEILAWFQLHNRRDAIRYYQEHMSRSDRLKDGFPPTLPTVYQLVSVQFSYINGLGNKRIFHKPSLITMFALSI